MGDKANSEIPVFDITNSNELSNKEKKIHEALKAIATLSEKQEHEPQDVYDYINSIRDSIREIVDDLINKYQINIIMQIYDLLDSENTINQEFEKICKMNNDIPVKCIDQLSITTIGLLLNLAQSKYNRNIDDIINQHVSKQYGEKCNYLKDILKAIYNTIKNSNYTKSTNKIIAKRIQEIAYPLDKVTSNLWGLKPGEQAELKAESDSDNQNGKQASIYVLLDFEKMKGTGVTISRPLTSYDKRVFIASSNLKEKGHDTVTITQIYGAMGNEGRPSASQRQKIMKSLEAMSVCRVTLDNTEEVKLYTQYEKVSRSFYLLPIIIDKGYVNGLMVDDAITIMEIPRLFTFAKKRGQIASTPTALLESPLSQTEANLKLEDYLLTRILRMKHAFKKSSKIKVNTILLDTIYKNCDINDKFKRSRSKEKIERLLNHWQNNSFITDYEITNRSIEIKL